MANHLVSNSYDYIIDTYLDNMQHTTTTLEWMPVESIATSSNISHYGYLNMTAIYIATYVCMLLWSR